MFFSLELFVYTQTMKFVNLHGHSHYSPLQAYGSPKDYIKRAKELGMESLALTDNGVIYGLIEFYKEAKKQGIKPILGCDLFVAPRKHTDKQNKSDGKPYKLTVIVENQEGYENLVNLVTTAHLDGFYYKPRVDYDLLKKHAKGLIILSGGLTSQLPRLILSGDNELIDEHVKKSIEIFGKDNYYLELNDNPESIPQQEVNEKLKELSKEHGLELVLTCNSFYPNKDDKKLHDIMICIQTQTNVKDENRLKFIGDFSLRDLGELSEQYKDYKGAIENTVKIAERCAIDFTFGENLIPSYKTPEGHDAQSYLRELCEQGLKKRFGNQEIPKEYIERLDYELETVHSMGFDTYFLIVQDFVIYAKNQGVVVGPGRGSAAGSIIAWTLSITELDPLKHGLFFERFLNPERVSMPDIDIDFADTRRDEVLDYVVKKYGRRNVAQIITFGTMAPKAAIRDAGRALGLTYSDVDLIAKAVPPAVLGKYAPLTESIEEDPELSKMYQDNYKARQVLDIAKKLEGTVRQVGTHACAVIISEKPLTKYTALQYGSGGEEIVTQYSAKPLEDLGLLKMDFLGLRNLTIIETAQKIIERTRGEKVDVTQAPMDDENTFKLLQKGETTGVFQLESAGMKRYLKELKPTEFGDIVAMSALYRPGPMKYIPDYIKGKHDPSSVKYFDDSFKDILSLTYGVAVYQEQILQLARDFAGFTLGEADILRKAVGKKNPALLAEQRQKFVKGANELGHSKEFAEGVFENVVEPFAGYGFNKAHAACYGLIAYHTAYLKANYPIEFMTALLCSDANNTDRVVLEIKECQDMGIDVLPPSVNESFSNFTVTEDNNIRFGLLAIKGVGEGPLRVIIDERRENGKFTSIEDFSSRLPSNVLNKKTIEALAYSGALDELGDRHQIAENYGEISSHAKAIRESKDRGQADIFSVLTEDESAKLKLQPVPELSTIQKLKLEKAYMGMYVSGHPLQGLDPYIKKRGRLISSLKLRNLGKKVHLVGIISEYRRLMTKSGSYMATFVLEDTSAKVPVVVFPRAFQKLHEILEEDRVINLTGKFDNGRGSYQVIADEIKELSLEKMIENAKANNLYKGLKGSLAIRNLEDILGEAGLNEEKDSFKTIVVPKTASTDTMRKLKNTLEQNPGDIEVELHLMSIDKKIKLPFRVKFTAELEKQVQSMLK